MLTQSYVTKGAMISPSGVPLRRNAQRKYDAIMKSACKLFLKRGYTHTSMDAIATDAGVSKQTVYSYFTNKDVLFCRMVEDECTRHSPPESMLENPALSPQDALLRIGKGYIDIIMGHRGVAILRLATMEAERHPRIAKLFFDSGPLRMQSLMAHYLQRQVEAGVFVIDNVEAAAAYFLSMIKGRYQMYMSLKIKPVPSRRELNDHVHDTVRMFFRMYGRQNYAM